MNEFELIKKYFKTEGDEQIVCGIGDDAAVLNLNLQNHTQLAITTDTLIGGVHFPESTHPADIGYKALAVNLSDLAAMGAKPAWVTLALTLPSKDENWLAQFCSGFYELLNQHQIALIGGDTTRGPLSITIQAIGTLSPDQSLLRSRAQPNDLIYVTGTLGDAGLMLAHIQQKIQVPSGHLPTLAKRLNRPTPRIAAGMALLNLAHAAIDISDGLVADLGHILTASHVGATIDVDRLPLSDALVKTCSAMSATQLALTAGDDYELCFTVPPKNKLAVELRLASLNCPYTCIGAITATSGLTCLNQNGTPFQGKIPHGYQHF